MSLARRSCAAMFLAAAIPSYAGAHLDGPWIVKFGAHNVAPESSNGALAGGALAVNVGTSTRPTATLEYLFTPNLGIELIAAWPFEHDVKLNGVESAKVKQLPPTLSLQYHFMSGTGVSPFLGIGLNYTRFFSIQEHGPIAGADLTLSDSWGFAAHAGFDFRINERWWAGVDLRWINIDTEAKVNGARVGTVNIDPLVYGAYVGYRF